jgi:urease accessory protein
LAVESNNVTNETILADWLTDQLTHGTARTDTILLRQAHRAAADPIALSTIADLAYATAASRERQIESLDQGKAFMLATTPWGVPDVPERIPYPVAVGAVAGAHRIPEDATASAYLQAFTTNLISAAVRLVPLGQTAGLRTLAALESTILQTAEATTNATLDDLGGCAFRSDLAAMRHETQYTRLFRS